MSRRPLAIAHGAGARVGEQVRCRPPRISEQEGVVAGLFRRSWPALLDRVSMRIGSTILILNGSAHDRRRVAMSGSFPDKGE